MGLKLMENARLEHTKNLKKSKYQEKNYSIFEG